MTAFSESVDMPRAACPGCGETLDRAAVLGDRGPRAGDLTVCIACSTALVLDARLVPHALRPAEFAALPGSAKAALATAQMVTTQFREQQKGRT